MYGARRTFLTLVRFRMPGLLDSSGAEGGQGSGLLAPAGSSVFMKRDGDCYYLHIPSSSSMVFLMSSSPCFDSIALIYFLGGTRYDTGSLD